MWQGLRDVRAIAAKIGDVVAPPPNDDDESEIEDESDVGTDDDNDQDDDVSEDDGAYNSDDDNESYKNATNAEDDDDLSADADVKEQRSPFGFVDMIHRAIDSQIRKTEDEDEDDSEIEVEFNEIVNSSDQTQNNNIFDRDSEKGAINTYQVAGNTNEKEISSPILSASPQNSPRRQSAHYTEHENTVASSASVPEPIFLGLRREKGYGLPNNVLPTSTNNIATNGVRDEKSNEHTEKVEVENVDSEGSSLSDGSDLDADNRKPRIVARKQEVAKQNGTNTDDTDDPRSLSNARRRLKGATYSTDSLLQGDFGRQLREQRRQTTRRSRTREKEDDHATNSSRSPSPEPQMNNSKSDTGPYHRIVEVPKSKSVLRVSKTAGAFGLSDDEEIDELDVPLHKGRLTKSPPSSPRHKEYRSKVGMVKFESASPQYDKSNISEQEQKNQFLSGSDLDQEAGKPPLSHDTAINSLPSDSILVKELEQKNRRLQILLEQKQNAMVDLQRQNECLTETGNQDQTKMMEMFKEKEQRLLESAAEEHKNEIRAIEAEFNMKLQLIQKDFDDERNASLKEREQIEFLMNEGNERAEEAERMLQQLRVQSDSAISQMQQHHARALRTTEDKLVQALSLLDEKTEGEENLKATIKALKSKMSEHHEGAQEVEDELEEIHAENEQLLKKNQQLEQERKSLLEKVDKLQSESDKLTHLKLEMRMLKEENDREKAKRQTVTASAESTSAQLIADRDAALSEVQDLQRELAAARADIEMIISDRDRALTANSNLQAALEAFQMEREAELAIWEENKLADENSLVAAHLATLDATRQINEAQIQSIQKAADNAVKNSMQEIKLLEDKVEMFRVENVQMRRSLDEAIHQLKATQDDIIDRTFMKNILFDWLTKKGVKERQDVLELMANILHFSDEEKQQVHIGHSTGLGFLVGNLPEAKADMEHLEGENVREKWVNFLLAETDD